MKQPSDIAVVASGCAAPPVIRTRAIAALAFACALAPLAGCHAPNQGSGGEQALARIQAPLAWTVNRAQATQHLSTSSMESRDAAPGHRFVVLDVSVRNRDAQPQVLSEGALVAVDESTLRTFDRPVTLLSDDYLSLQVLAPAQSVHGKIAYEVPEDLSGVLYWKPGDGSERILLNVLTPPAPQRTFADAGDGDSGPGAEVAQVGSSRGDSSQDESSRDEPVRGTPTVAERATPAGQPARPVTRAPSASPRPDHRVASVTPPTPQPARTPAAIAASARSARARRHTPEAAVTQARARDVATIAVPAPARAPSPQVDTEQARRLACEGLVARDDPAEKARSLGFFAESCRDYALPTHWRPEPAPRRSLVERASALLARVVVAPRVVRISDCSGSTAPVDLMVCGDPALSAMEHRLAQSVARARAQVDDPGALQREQEHWRGRVRNACDTADCLEQAYGRRIAQLDALAPMRP